MWDSHGCGSEDKAAQGLDIRVMYDDSGSISTFNMDTRQLRSKGIKMRAFFNPLIAREGYAHCDHRKCS